MEVAQTAHTAKPAAAKAAPAPAAARGASPLASPAGPNATTNKEQFLNLLVAQLKNQDPLDPMNNEAFLSQLAQFTSLERLQNIEKQGENTVNVSAVGLIGKTVEAETEDNGKVSGVVDSVEVTKKGTMLKINSLLVSLGDITVVKDAGPKK